MSGVRLMPSSSEGDLKRVKHKKPTMKHAALEIMKGATLNMNNHMNGDQGLGSNTRILVICEKFTGSITSQLLGKLNYSVTQVESATQASDLLSEHNDFGLIILFTTGHTGTVGVAGNPINHSTGGMNSLAHPAFNSLELLAKLKEMSNLPVIVVATAGGVDVAVKHLKAGAQDCLFAPLCKEIMEARIMSALQIRVLNDKMATMRRTMEEERRNGHKGEEERAGTNARYNLTVIREELDEELRKTIAEFEERLSLATKEIANKDEEITSLQQQVQALSWKASLLESEKHKGETLTQQLSTKDKEIDVLKKNLGKALETPIQVVTRTLTQLAQGNLDQKELKSALTTLLQSISSSTQLYQPALTKAQFLNSLNLDEMTRKWLLSEFTRPSQTIPVIPAVAASSYPNPSPNPNPNSHSISVSPTKELLNNNNTTNLNGSSDGASTSSNSSTSSSKTPSRETSLKIQTNINSSPTQTHTQRTSPRLTPIVPSNSTQPQLLPQPQQSQTQQTQPQQAQSTSPIQHRVNFVNSSVIPKPTPDPTRLLDSGRNVDDILARSKTIDLNIINTWHCNVWMHDSEEIFLLAWTIMQDLGLADRFNINVVTFFQFMETLQTSYLANSYHNFQHAFDVAQTCYLMVKSSNVRNFLTHMDILVLIIGALCHDIDHPGLNNMYQVNTRSPLSLLYNDLSVLENHHCARAFYFLNQERTNILFGLSPTDYKEFRRTMVSAILATDMTTHFELLTRFTTHLEARPFSIDNKEDRQLIVDIILHSADISNTCKPFNISKRWSDLLLEEFLAQGDLERDQGMAVSPFMDRNTTDQVKMTLNFMDYMVAPLFTSLAKQFTGMRPLLEHLQINRAQWAEKSYEPPKIQIQEPHKEGSQPANGAGGGSGGGSGAGGNSGAPNGNTTNFAAAALSKTKKRSFSSPNELHRPSAYLVLTNMSTAKSNLSTRSPSSELKRINLYPTSGEGKISPPADARPKTNFVLPKLT